jgi:curved DNA-binding protein CbpA
MTAPTATGNLTGTPFCELLVYALGQRLTGSLVFECPDHGKHALLLEAGAAVKARVDQAGTRLGQVLIQLGRVTEEAVRLTLEDVDDDLFGQRLFARGAVDSASLVEGLSEQLRRQLSWLAGVPPATVFAYFDGVNLLQYWGGEPLRIDPLASIWSAVETRAPRDRVSATLGSLADRKLRFHADARIARFGFPSRARAVFDVLRVKPQSLAELEATGLIERGLLHELLYTLAVTRHLDTGVPPLGVTPGAARTAEPLPRRKLTPPPSTAARAPSPKLRAAAPAPAEPVHVAEPGERVALENVQTGRFLSREEIEAKLSSFENLSHYELLEVPPEATPDQLSLAFPTLARRWHPDRLSPEYGDLREAVTRIFARMTEASRVLGNATSRSAYDEALAGQRVQDDEQEQVELVLRAAEAFQKAEILFKKRDIENAEKLARMAFESDPNQPEYAALYAWIRARRPGATESDLADALALLKKALAKQTNNVKIHYYLATVLKLSGQTAAALREFKHVADRDPSNVEAARELRLNDMRRGHSQNAPGGGGGLFSKLFKR